MPRNLDHRCELPASHSSPEALTQPAGWSMIGDPFVVPATITVPSPDDGAYVHDPQSGYSPVNHANAGQGAFIFLTQGGSMTFAPQ